MATLISEYVAQCLQDFENASLELNRLNDAACERFLDEFARFKLWAGNIGAHRRGRSSLDWRLRDASHLRDLVINLLKDIKNTLHDALSMLSQDSITHVDDVIHRSDTPISEGSLGTGEIEELGQESGFDEIIAEVNDIIRCLLRLSVSIKNPAPHDHFMSSKLIDTSYFEEYDLQHVEAKFPHANADLAHRIGKAISQRRQYFRYREAHHHKLNSGLALDSRRSEGGGAQSTIASSIPAALKDDGKSHPAFSRLDEEETSNSGASQTSYAISGPPSGRLRMPSLPERASDGPFECPFCYMMLSVTTEIQWRNHVSSDLRPYICLEIDCLTPEHQFARRHDWLEHIGQKHQRVFRCPYSCRDADFATSSQLEHHLQKFHPEVSSQRDLSVMLDLCERPMPWPEERDCPLCHQTLRSKQEYGRHVGRHQTELALFALPSNGQEEEDTDEGSDDDRMRELNEASDSDRSRLSEEDDEVRRSHMSPSPTDRSLDNDVHLAKPAPDDPPIRLKDAVGRKFSFPFHICRTWEGMEDLIKQAFLHVDLIGPHVQVGHYDLTGPNGEIIRPQVWDKVVEPGWQITMHMWPLDRAGLAVKSDPLNLGSRMEYSDSNQDALPKDEPLGYYRVAISCYRLSQNDLQHYLERAFPGTEIKITAHDYTTPSGFYKVVLPRDLTKSEFRMIEELRSYPGPEGTIRAGPLQRLRPPFKPPLPWTTEDPDD